MIIVKYYIENISNLNYLSKYYLRIKQNKKNAIKKIKYLDDKKRAILGECLLINGLYKESLDMLKENKEILDKISDYLYEHETITGKEFMKIFRELKGIDDPDDNDDIFEEDEFFVDEDE